MSVSSISISVPSIYVIFTKQKFVRDLSECLSLEDLLLPLGDLLLIFFERPTFEFLLPVARRGASSVAAATRFVVSKIFAWSLFVSTRSLWLFDADFSAIELSVIEPETFSCIIASFKGDEGETTAFTKIYSNQSEIKMFTWYKGPLRVQRWRLYRTFRKLHELQILRFYDSSFRYKARFLLKFNWQTWEFSPLFPLGEPERSLPPSGDLLLELDLESKMLIFILENSKPRGERPFLLSSLSCSLSLLPALPSALAIEKLILGCKMWKKWGKIGILDL